MKKGGCECGKVRFVAEELRDDRITVCHCGQCRRTSGHIWASAYAMMDKFRFEEEEGLEWFASSSFAKRGFCKFCGSSLFYRTNGEDGIAIASGCLDDTSDMHISRHIFVADKAGYYQIDDGVPQFDKG